MRKRNLKCLFDTIFWYSLYMLPIILLVLNWSTGGTLSLSEIFNNIGLSIITDNIVFTGLVSMFGAGSTILPVFTNTIILEYLTYFIMLMIIHIFVDVLLFIPRWCNKMLDGGEKHDELWK